MAKYFSHRRWADKVYNPDIVSKSEKLTRSRDTRRQDI
jgi:hypothetical protein